MMERWAVLVSPAALIALPVAFIAHLASSSANYQSRKRTLAKLPAMPCCAELL